MAEAPLYRRLGAKPESLAPEADALCCKTQRLLYVLHTLDKWDKWWYLWPRK
jgi:hypothetical protein